MAKKNSAGEVDVLLEELREALKIDKHSLDDELMYQASLYGRVAEEHAYAVSRRDAANDECKRTDAELDLEIRRGFEAEERKYTESLIHSTVQADPRHTEARTRYLNANRDVDLLEALRDSFRQRGFMLRDMVELYVREYYNRQEHHTDVETADRMRADKNRTKVAEKRSESDYQKRRKNTRNRL